MVAAILACTSLPSLAADTARRLVTRADAPGTPGTRHALNLPAATNLVDDARASGRERVPILLFFDRGDCPYCEQALREYLVPMSRDANWRSRAIFRQVEIDQAHALVDFDGVPTTHRAFAQRHRVRFTPTIHFVGARGDALAEPLVGLMPDFYSAYLEQRLEGARAKLQAVGTQR